MQGLRTPRLQLDPLVAAHAGDMFELLRDPQIYRYLDFEAPPNIAHLAAVYQRLEARQSPDGAEQWLNWVLRLPGAGLLGFVQATVTVGGDAFVAYLLNPRYWGHGYAFEAMQAMLAHLQHAHAVRRFLATVEHDNARSTALLTRLGFVPADGDMAAAHSLTASERLFVKPVSSHTKRS